MPERLFFGQETVEWSWGVGIRMKCIKPAIWKAEDKPSYKEVIGTLSPIITMGPGLPLYTSSLTVLQTEEYLLTQLECSSFSYFIFFS